MNDKKQFEEMVKILDECCNEYDEQGNHLGNKCASCECWCDTNHVCVSYNTKEAEALYNAGYRKQEWISVDERLPENYVRVLVAIKSNRSYTNIDTDRLYNGVFVRWHKDVTHWMPLPELPKGGAE